MDKKIEAALEKYKALIENQLARVARMKADTGAVDYTKLDKIVIGVCGGDGIGPVITNEAHRFWSICSKTRSKKGGLNLRLLTA